MHKNSTTGIIFGFLLFFMLVFLLLGKISFFQVLNAPIVFLLTPFQSMTFSIFHKGSDNWEIQKIKKENVALQKQLIDQKKIISENDALRDQFRINKPSNTALLPANVIGAPGFVPGISQPESLIINVGKKDSIEKGQAVISNNNLIGSIERVSYSLSVVRPVQHFSKPLPVKTLETNATGLLRTSDGLQLDNILLADTLKKGDFVVTKGTIDANGIGIPPDIIIGKIVSIDKKASNLFQTAKIVSLVDLSKIGVVFVVQGVK